MFRYSDGPPLINGPASYQTKTVNVEVKSCSFALGILRTETYNFVEPLTVYHYSTREVLTDCNFFSPPTFPLLLIQLRCQSISAYRNSPPPPPSQAGFAPVSKLGVKSKSLVLHWARYVSCFVIQLEVKLSKVIVTSFVHVFRCYETATCICFEF